MTEYAKDAYEMARAIAHKKHGTIRQLLHNVLNGAECLKCSREKRKYTNLSFVNEAKNVHGNKYDYSLVEYNYCKTKIKIICQKHGIFEQNPIQHIRGSGCPSCFGNKKLDKFSFIDKAKKIHGNKYDYSLVEYINCNTKIKIVCLMHGVFEQTPEIHLRQKSGCKKMFFIKR